MTPDEIRSDLWSNEAADNDLILQELTAQVAELNQNLKRIAHALLKEKP